MDTLLNLKSNLIQNFYILGLSPSTFFQKTEEGKGTFLNIFQEPKIELNPEVISKFPPENGNYNSTKDEVVLAHCFPHGLSALQAKDEKMPCTYFEFHLDNILFNYAEEDKKFYSKIYFTCLTFYESLELYNNYKQEIICTLNNNPHYSLKIENNNDGLVPITSPLLKKYFIPKTICFASLMPFSKELRNILKIIHSLYCVKTKDSSVIPIEKFLEQLVLQLPLPISIGEQVEIQFKLGIDLEEKMDKKTLKQKSKSSGLLTSNFNFKKKANIGDPLVTKIKFPLYNIDEANLRYDNTISFEDCFSFFQVDDIIRIYKYILLEIPIIFFCQRKEYLSNFIENFLGFLSPFKYEFPNIAILPKKYYGFINSEPKFIFGINEKYTPDFFIKNNIDIDKNIVVVYIDTDNKTESKIEEIWKINNQQEKNYLSIDKDKEIDRSFVKINSKIIEYNIITNDYVVYDKSKIELISLDFPSDPKKRLSTLISSILRKDKTDDNFNYKIQQGFYKFLAGLFNGFSDYYLKSKFFYDAMRNGNCGENMRYKSQMANILDINFLKEIINIDEFIKSCSKDTQPFYYVFFHTKMFLYFLRERIYFSNKFHSLPYYQFDIFIYLKKHKDVRKKHKDYYEKVRNGNFEKPKVHKTIEIIIKTGFNFNDLEIKTIKENKIDLLLKYAQLPNIEKDDTLKKITYVLFPKLLFDDSFFQTKYENLFLLHGIMTPSDKIILEHKKQCSQKSNSYKKDFKCALYPYIAENAKIQRGADFSIDVYEYVQFDWLILLCCALEYCEPMEREIRLEKVFEILDKISYLEEKVLIFIYINFLKYGNKTQCIKMLERIYKFIGHSNYLFMVLLCIKLEEENVPINNEDINNSINKNDNDNIIINNNNKFNYRNNTYVFKPRSIILVNENFFQRRCSLPSGINFSAINSYGPKLSVAIPNKKNAKSFHISQNPAFNQDMNHKEKIIFNRGQLCPKCKETTLFDPSEIIGLTIDKVKVNLEYVCKKCGHIMDNIKIKYQILLINKKKNQSFVTKLGEFLLFSPYRLYMNLKFDQLNLKDYSLKINNIYREKKNEFFNYIFYFCRKNLTFDFLIPYKNLNNIDLELIENKLGDIISDINKKRFSIKGPINPENLTKEMENEFVPINISDNTNFDKIIFTDLSPCYTTGAFEGIYGTENENEKNQETNDNKNSDNSFSFLSKSK